MGKPEITRKNIILASIKLAKENGPSNVTVREICDEAGISKNTFYLYFHNRDEVFGETYFTDDDEKQRRFPQIMLEYDSPLEQFWELLKIDIERHVSYGPKLLATISMQNVQQINFFSDDPDQQPETVKVFTSLVGKMQRMGEIKNMADPFHIVKAVYNSAIGVDIRWTQLDGVETKKDTAHSVRCLLFLYSVWRCTDSVRRQFLSPFGLEEVGQFLDAVEARVVEGTADVVEEEFLVGGELVVVEHAKRVLVHEERRFLAFGQTVPAEAALAPSK